jgi:hypothetical protein
VADPARGIREFIVGSGGQHLLQPVSPLANLEAMNDTTWGALGLTLRDTGYDWYFFHSIQDPEGRNSDFGSAACH